MAIDELTAAGAGEERISELKAERRDLSEEGEKARVRVIGSAAVLKHIEWHLHYLKGCGTRG